MDQLDNHLEALIFSSNQPIRLSEIKSCMEESLGITFIEEDLKTSIQNIVEKYQSPSHAIEVIEMAGGWQFVTKAAYHHTIGIFLKQHSNKKLSRSALETLSIIAYKQPVSKSELEKIRGVNCDYAIQKLMEKELVEITGRDEGPGRPLLYGTSVKFMDYFGLNNLNELPKLKEFESPDNEIGIPAVAEDKEN
ncbi:MAG: SMC-Scp complex subunit ScpB [Saprospiraceae bacterium]